MSTMQTVISLRLPKEDLTLIEEVASWKNSDKSTAIRELVELGGIYFAVLEYKKGKISIEKAAELAHLSLSEMIDLLASLGVESKLEIEDYLEGAKTVKKLF
ncbi:MAG: UPF0175 family protein [Nanoarchaeota archaeon]